MDSLSEFLNDNLENMLNYVLGKRGKCTSLQQNKIDLVIRLSSAPRRLPGVGDMYTESL